MSDTAEFYTLSGQLTTATPTLLVGDHGSSDTTASGRSRQAIVGPPRIQPTFGEPDVGESADATLSSGSSSRRPTRVGAGRVAPRRVGLVPEVRAAIKAYHQAAAAAADGLVESAKGGDVEGVALAVREIAANVDSLWRCRKAREMDWQAILNHIRLMFRQAVIGERAEKMSSDECRAVRELVGMIGLAMRTADDLNEAIRLVRDAGFDPYSAISHPDE